MTAADAASRDTRPERQVVVGLEIHAQLATGRKLFCGCATDAGAEPNTNICPTCVGHPGALPTLDGVAVELGMRAALALECRVATALRFDRKAYGYPDLPKGYQMTQQDHPLGEDGGFVFRDELGSVRRIGVLRAHLEEDAGRIVRGAGVEVADGECLVDLNRAGVPLLEIVLAPELSRAGEAAACLRALRRLLRHLGVADCVLEQGGFRCDVNVSLSGGEVSGTRTEIKNLNSYRFVAQAIEREVERQSALLDAGEVVESQTLGYDPDGDRIVIQRSKEAAREYLFLPEPDLPPVLLAPGFAARVGAALPERPHEQALRYERDLELPEGFVQALQDEPERVRVFEAALADGSPPGETARLVLEVLVPLARERGLTLDALCAPGALDPGRLDALCTAQAAGELRAGELPQLARVLLDESAVTLAELLDRRELSRRAQPGPEQLERAVQETLDEHPELVAAWRAGRTAVLNPLVGAARTRLGGVGDARALQARLRAALGEDAQADPYDSSGSSPGSSPGSNPGSNPDR